MLATSKEWERPRPVEASCSEGVLKVLKGCRTILKGNRHDSLYILQGSVETGESNLAETAKDETRLWHSRLAHMSQRGMELLVKKGFLDSSKIKEWTKREDEKSEILQGLGMPHQDEPVALGVSYLAVVSPGPSLAGSLHRHLLWNEYINHSEESLFFCEGERRTGLNNEFRKAQEGAWKKHSKELGHRAAIGQDLP
ncbi:GAG-pre-integrase domain (mitochondrion) [Arabidopsis suecica]|uniref:GAG-pre-integrase domain n=1 Tax=Arabidopsis suecica TaxID=45249 RepID=A0A8T1XGL0_ARASU|nr:GAG-pre-integrase domain [Arabidopsis suecica]